MFRKRRYSNLRKLRSRRAKSKLNRLNLTRSQEIVSTPTKKLTLLGYFYENLPNLYHYTTCTIDQLEKLCNQTAKQHVSLNNSTREICPFICFFCEDLIYEPVTLSCGHTYCEQCLTNNDRSLPKICPCCSNHNTENIHSPIASARDNLYRKNHFLKQLFERSNQLKFKCQTILLRNQAQNEYSNGRFQDAINISSQIIDKCTNDYLTLYCRAKAYAAIKEYDKTLDDLNSIIRLKPRWIKAYLYQSEILFEIGQLPAAVISSLKALEIDPDNSIASQNTARYLHEFLKNYNSNEIIEKFKFEFEKNENNVLSNDNNSKNAMDTVTNDQRLTLCKSNENPTELCLCTDFDYQSFQSTDFECAVCVNLLWMPITTPCGHVFCRECLIRSVDNNQSLCPICKYSLEEFFPMLIKSEVNQTDIITRMTETYFSTEYNERRKIFEQENNRNIPHEKSLNDASAPVQFEIPIFVCVLALPDCSCPLHVFEPRYRLMMRRTMESESRTFGMCAYDEQTGTFSDYGTLLFIRNITFTPDGRSMIDTIGQRRFRVIERGIKDGYNTAKVELLHDISIPQHEFDDLREYNRTTYSRVHDWFINLDLFHQILIARQIEDYPECDDLVLESVNGPRWIWIILNFLPIDHLLKYTALASQSVRIRLQIINDTINFLRNR